jgi:nitrogen-specific signal transduction histidine kinase
MGLHASTSAPRPERDTLAHELNNELAIIIGECELLEAMLEGDAASSARLKVIRMTACRIADTLSRPRP